MSLMERIKDKARRHPTCILLPEGTEERTLRAARIIADEGIAAVKLLGQEALVREKARALGVCLDGIPVVQPERHEKFAGYIETFYQMRKDKGLTQRRAEELLQTPLYFACMMIKMGEAHGMVAGAENTTSDTLRPALQIIKMAPGISVVSSCFIMEVPNFNGGNGVFIFADCAVNPVPDADQLAAIAVASAATGKALTGMHPRVAMLSFSTKGSARHELVDKVVLATQKAKALAPGLDIDGELQADAALVESVAGLKSPGSSVAGRANVLIFPDLQSGNIAYKLVQRLAKAEAIGPISQGFQKPVNDLSRGCSVEDIVSVTAITAVQAHNQNNNN